MEKVKNKSGAFIKADLASVTGRRRRHHARGFRVSITDSTGRAAYPIASFTWLLIPEEIKDQQKKKVITDFVKWMLGPGQKMTAALEYAPLPAAVVAKEEKAVVKIH